MYDKEKIDKLKLLLKELFQFDNSDLDFGIYRIINIKRKEISDFIDKELFDIINEKIKTLGDNSELKKTVDSLRADIEESFGCNINEAKTKYAETPKVKNYIEKEKELKAIEKETEIEGEIYDDIINFFSRYYDKGDFISKRRYSKDNKYAIPYNGEEVYLYWANNDQYYIKTGENFKSYSFKAGSIKVNFEIVSEEVELEKGNIKDPEKKFFIFHDASYYANKKLVSVLFGYRGLADEETKAILDMTQKKSAGKDEVNAYNMKKINEKIALFGLSDLQKKHTKMDGEKSDKSELEWHLNKYTTKNTTDYFIHKNLKRFLSQELDFYIKNEILHIDDIESKEDMEINLNKIKAFKDICLKIIEFLSQVEDFQKMLWEKKKFVVSTNYCITLDYVPEKYYSKILENKAQLEEWAKLYSFDIGKESKGIKGKLPFQGSPEIEIMLEVLKKNPTLAIDTKFYDADFKYQLLSEIDGLDEKTNGILINSENFQALNLLLNKYREKIKCCYIDPPYNTGSDDFIYKDGFSHSSWLSMIESRIILLKHLLLENGSLFISIDDDEQKRLSLLLEKIFGENNFVSNIIWEKKFAPQNDAKWFSDNHDHIICFAKNKDIWRPNQLPRTEEQNSRYKNPDNDLRGPWASSDLSVKTYNAAYRFPIKTPSGKIIQLPPGRCWMTNEQKIQELIKDNRLWFGEQGNNLPRLKRFLSEVKDGITPLTIWTRKDVGDTQEAKRDILKLIPENLFQTPKAVRLLNRIITLSMGKHSNDIVIDFFAGSGTTGHAVLKLNREDGGIRKFILVEMAEYFDSVMKPRILKVIYSDNWKEGKPLDNNGSKKHIIKYQTLEQYEDSLNNINFTEPNVIAKESKDYKIKYMLEFESKGSNVFLNLAALDNPFEYKLKFEENNELKEKNIDLIETFNYLAGINVNSIKKMTNGPITYVIVKGSHNEKDVIVIWRNKPDDFDPVKDKEFIEKEILKDDYDEILVNGNSLVKDAKSIDEIFKTNMFVR